MKNWHNIPIIHKRDLALLTVTSNTDVCVVPGRVKEGVDYGQRPTIKGGLVFHSIFKKKTLAENSVQKL